MKCELGKTSQNFKTVKEMVNWLLDNEGKQLVDKYGRGWKYNNYFFYFKDIGENDKFESGIKCLHLFNTVFQKEE